MIAATLPYQPPPERGRGGALILAVLMHSLLFALLFFGLSWQSQEPAVIEAEIWSASPQIAAPAPRPVAEPEPPAPTRKPPIEVKPEPAPIKPDIALKKEKEPPKKKPPVKVEPRPEPKVVPKVAAKVEPKPPVKAPAPPAPVLPAPPPPSVVTPPPPPTPAMPSDLANLLADAKASTGTAAQTSAPRNDPGYAEAIRAKVLSNLRFPVPADLKGNPEAHFVIEQLPSGEIKTISKRKASGMPAFDAAVERAISASSPLPKGRDGRVERSLLLVFSPLDRR